MWMDVWTDMTKLMVAFSNIVNVPKNGTCDILVFTYFVLKMEHVISLYSLTLY